MKISELEKDSKVINLVGTITNLGEVSTTPNGVKYCEGLIEDETGVVMITFWNGDADKFSVGNKILMSTGWCKEFKGELQVTSGKFGKISIVPPTPEKVKE